MKEHLKTTARDFFVIVTLINVATFVLGSVFRPEDRFGYDAFLSPIIYGFLATIPILVTYSSKELTVKQMIVREIIRFFLIEILLIVFGFGASGLSAENMPAVIGFAVSVAVIYVLVYVISWLLDCKEAQKMTEDLLHYQKNFME